MGQQGGISSGGSVLIGKYLGNGNIRAVRSVGYRITLYALIFGVLAGITILLIRPLIFHVVNLNAAAQSYLNGMLYICAYYCIGKSLNSTVIGGIFCAGGDPKFGLLCDTVVMWGVTLPFSFVCAFIWHLSPVALYAVISLDEFIKLPATFIRYRRYKWLNNITRDFA
jgi:Na+-driven multidrug efflux pump